MFNCVRHAISLYFTLHTSFPTNRNYSTSIHSLSRSFLGSWFQQLRQLHVPKDEQDGVPSTPPITGRRTSLKRIGSRYAGWKDACSLYPSSLRCTCYSEVINIHAQCISCGTHGVLVPVHPQKERGFCEPRCLGIQDLPPPSFSRGNRNKYPP